MRATGLGSAKSGCAPLHPLLLPLTSVYPMVWKAIVKTLYYFPEIG
jgi:hypothetical protein